MAVIKCKMCGGDLILIEGSTVCECDSCGTRQTVPSADNEKKLTLFSRAGRLLRACEFDKAAGVFETIVADFPQEAEAYWGLVLCKYGIEYVDDPATGKKIPTCHRSSFDSVLDDSNFEQACENTDAVARRVYRDEARQIEALRQAILQVSGREEPYDVFISYKETDENGQRTLDSVLAQDIYKELTGEGYRVFFSRISLEDKLGTEYEPYIFAALNSAKVMIVVGTDYENFDAVWVKNEWSRFLKLIAKGEKKTLIPAFKNMDAYDMPKEFARLAALDLGKVGAMQDLLHGVEKLVGRKKAEPAQPQPVQQPVYVSGGPNVTAMIERGHQALEDGEWQKADEFFDQALNMDAKCAEAFLGKFLAQEQAVSLDTLLDRRLADCDKKVFSVNKSIPIDKTIGEKLYKTYGVPGYLNRTTIDKILYFSPLYSSTEQSRGSMPREEMDRLHSDKLFSRAKKYASGKTAEEIRKAEEHFEGELVRRATEAKEKDREEYEKKREEYSAFLAEAKTRIAALSEEAAAQREEDYQQACQLRQAAQTIPEYGEALRKLRSEGLAEYKDCARLADECRAAIAEMEERQRQEREAKEQERQRREAEEKAREREEFDRRWAENKKAEAEKKKRQNTILLAVTSVLVVALAAILIVTKILIPNNRYKEAEALLQQGRDVEAYQTFLALDDYKDSYTRALNIKTDLEKEHNYILTECGEPITLGHYEQDNDAENGKEEIEWVVLAKEEDRILVISRYALDCQPYHTQSEDVTWETCSLRNWLNDSFYTSAFDAQEQQIILTSDVEAEENTEYGTDAGEDTEDKIFLLSIQEAEDLLSANMRRCEATEYNTALGCKQNIINSQKYCFWWLRSPGMSLSNAAYVNYKGEIRAIGGTVSANLEGDYEKVSVRPVMWIGIGNP